MKPYPSYKPTGLKWLPEVPRGWDVLRCKNIFTVVNQRSAEGKEKLLSVSEHYGVIERSKADVTMFMAESYEGYKLCWPDDLVVNSLWAWSYGMGFSHDHGIISTAYSVYRLKDKSRTMPAYYNYLIRGTDYHWEMRVRSKGLWKSRYQLSDDDFMSAPILIPPADEQKAIVAYLDAKTAKFDRLIKLKEREIELLQEKKQVVISTVVTRGLDPNVKLVDSGVDWIGKVPDGWRMYRLRHTAAARFEYGANSSGVDYNEDLPRYIRITDIDSNGNLKDEGKLSLGATGAADYALEDGDILFARSGGTVGKSFLYKCSYGQCCYAGYLIRYRPDKSVILPEYAYVFTNSSLYAFWLSRIFIQATIQNVSAERYKNLQIPIPPLPEQREIVAYLDAETGKTDKAIAAVVRQIALLKEYRTRLISDAVTGRIDLREAMA